MKPISLVIDGINSFYDRQEIDFRFDGLFCICGDTGSGKTTILDCIIIALYGNGKRVSSLGDYINLRRDRAEIKLVFETDVEGERQSFEVTRTLVRDGSSRAKLVNLTMGETVAEQTSAVNSALAAMIGLTREDFTQVVILEQGKFAKFLTASKKERNETVGNLFKLHKYRDLGSKFYARMKEVKTELDGLAERLDELKEVTAAAVLEAERSIKHGTKRAVELAETEAKVNAQISAMLEDERKYNKCLEAEKKLDAQLIEFQRLNELLAVTRGKLTESNDTYKKLGEKIEACRLVEARAEAIRGLIEELSKRTEALNRLREEWKAASAQEADYAKEYGEKVENSRKLQSMLDSCISDAFCIAELSENGEHFDVFDIKTKADKLTSDYQAAYAAYDEFDKKSAELSKRVETDTQNLGVCMMEAQKSAEEIEKLKREVANLKETLKAEQRAKAAQHIREGLHEGDICPVCGGTITGECVKTEYGQTEAMLEANEKKLEQAEAQFNKLENNRYSFSTRLEESRKAYIEAQKQLSVYDEKLRFLREIIKRPDRIDNLPALAAKACEFSGKLLETNSQASVIKERCEAAAKRAEDIKKRGEVERAEVDRLQKAINERGEVEQELKANSEALAALSAEAEKLYAQIKEDEAQRDNLTARIGAAEATVKMLKEEIADKPAFDSAVLEENRGVAERLKKEREELIAETAGKEKELESLKKNLEKKRGLEADKADKKRRYDVFSDIYKLVSGDKFIEYVAEEYILQFTSAASLVLNDVTGGKYTLEYTGGEFFVKDFLAGGMERKASTLSGGETFLASLSLAIAISREIARYKTYEFFFLDEGFGTLDSDSLDTVMNALLSLSSDTLVGVVTHRSELTDRIFDKITVISAAGDRGSRVERSD